MTLLSCIFHKGYYFFIIYWLIELIMSITRISLNNNKISSLDYVIEDFVFEEELIKLILLNISDLLSGFLVLYTKIIMKSFKKRKKTKIIQKITSLESSLIYNKITYTYNHNHKILLILLISLLDFIARSAYFFSTLPKIQRLKPRQVDWMLSIDIIARTLLSIFFLKIKVRKHHKLSIALCMLGFILMFVSDTMTIIKEHIDSRDVIIFMIIIFPRVILFPLEDVFNKILLFNDFLLPHSLIFWRGVTQFFFLLFILPTLYFNNKINFEYLKEIKTTKKIIHSIVFTIISLIRNLCLMNVIYIFNSYYVSFLLVIIIFDNTIQQFLENDKKYSFKEIKGIIYFSIDILALMIIMLGTLIFNEMIIINACGLKEKTKKGLLSIEKIDGENLDSFYYADDDENTEEDKKEKKDNNNDNIYQSGKKIAVSYSCDFSKSNNINENNYIVNTINTESF